MLTSRTEFPAPPRPGMAMRPAAAAAAAADGMARGARAPCTLGTDRPAEGEAGTGERRCPKSGNGKRGPAHPHAKDTPAVSPRPQPAGAAVLRTGHAGVGPSARAPQHRSSGSTDAERSPAAAAVRACRRPPPCRRHAGQGTAGCHAAGTRPSTGTLGCARPAHAALLTRTLKSTY